MALHYQPQRYRYTLHHHIAILVRCRRCPRADNEDATLSPRQYHTHRKRLQSIRHRSRTFDDFLGSISVSFWFCKLHNSPPNRWPRFALSSADLVKLLFFFVRGGIIVFRFFFRGGSSLWLTLFFTQG